jgi:DNA-binding XRE family transcriptional regulator
MLSIKQIKAARVMLGWNQQQLAEAARVSVQTVQRVEVVGLDHSTAETAAAVQEALERAGVIFIKNGVQLRKGE